MSLEEVIISPIHSQRYTSVKLFDQQETEQIVNKSQKVFKDVWKAVEIDEKIHVLNQFIDEFLAMKEEIVDELTWLIGRPRRFNYNEIKGVEERARYLISIAKNALNPIELEPKENFKRYIKKEPLGIVFIIAPWNYPYLTSINAIIPALLSGNTVILKHSPQTFPCAEKLAKAFKNAGLPDGVFQYAHIDHQVAALVIQNPLIKHIQFTGSVKGGLQVLKTASSNLTGVGMELGGKDAAYVRADADLDYAAENIVDGAFYNSGQSCCAIERVYVHQDVYENFVEKVKKIGDGYIVGDPFSDQVHLGPVVKTQFADLIRDHIQDAIKQGAVPLLSESKHSMCKPGTPYVAPQIFVHVHHQMKIMKYETFGPVFGIMKVKDDEEAIQLMNDSDLGLTASIWTEDVIQSEAIAERLDVGTVFMNRCDYLDPALAWTGVKNSGRGCSLSKLSFDQFTRPKSFHFRVKH